MAGEKKKIAVVVGTVTDDVRMLDTPKLNICALHVTAGARARILKAGGSIITFDKLALSAPTGANTVLLQGAFHVLPVFALLAPGAMAAWFLAGPVSAARHVCISASLGHLRTGVGTTPVAHWC